MRRTVLSSRPSRREFAIGAAAGVAAAALPASPSLAQDQAQAWELAVRKILGEAKPIDGKMTLELPEIAENGNTVPLMVTVNSPMQDKDYVSDILVVSEGNPRPGVAHFHLTPMSGKAIASTRIRLAATQNIVVVAKTSTGQFFTDAKLVKVTIGGCGG